MNLKNLAMMKAVARMEKVVHHTSYEHDYSLMNFIFKILIFGLLLFIIGYIIIYQWYFLGNSIYGKAFGGTWILIEFLNFVWIRVKLRKGTL